MTREDLLTWMPHLEAEADRRGLDTYAMVANRAIAMLQRDGEAIAALEAERDQLRDVLWRGGFVMCDIPACNCGSWHHKYGLPERFREIADVLAEAGHELCNENGNLPIRALKSLAAERDQLREERDRLKAALSKSEQTAERWRADCMYFWSMS